MLTLNPGSSCDVCAEEYGPHCLPHSIPCGHVLCSSCCTTIAEKTSSRFAPACPFCREQFTSDSVRLIRMDFNTSGWSTPRRLPNIEANAPDFISDAWSKRLALADGCSRSRQDARRLEAKVAKVAAKKCSVEEVTTLHKELQEWLTSDTKPDDDTSSLTLSAALLRAILMNHVAHSESSRLAKNVEATLKTKIDDLELMNSKLDAELRRQRLQSSQKAQECQSLRQELSRLKVVSTTLVTPPLPPAEWRQRSPSPPPLPGGYSSSSSQAALSRFNSTHMRSPSMFSSTASPGLARSQTPGPMSSTRSQTPTPARSQTPGPTRAHSMSVSPTRGPPHSRHVSMSSTPLRSRTPAPPQAAPRPRRLSESHPSPPKLAARTLSEEKHDAHQRWLPPSHGDPAKFPARSPSRASQTYNTFRYRVEEEED
ncbi:hypothetical protein B0H15DRAFT_459902 [Mycena belliarum]|uniref:RING-type domain-containing protein n=1 Tax=Mycena belliarum TaxID=1033014 RepID=A0AAD6ULE9_9AGAR|nr:hypothetical protein B0H15DRAFT_459902 [Mycena belliae]